MKLAVTYENGEVFQHFGHCRQFAFYEVEDGRVLSGEVISAEGSGHGALAGFLKEHGADALICGGIGGGARAALEEAGIELYPGVTGDVSSAAEAYVKGKLAYDLNAGCSHHHGGACGEDKHGCMGK